MRQATAKISTVLRKQTTALRKQTTSLRNRMKPSAASDEESVDLRIDIDPPEEKPSAGAAPAEREAELPARVVEAAARVDEKETAHAKFQTQSATSWHPTRSKPLVVIS